MAATAHTYEASVSLKALEMEPTEKGTISCLTSPRDPDEDLWKPH